MACVQALNASHAGRASPTLAGNLMCISGALRRPEACCTVTANNPLTRRLIDTGSSTAGAARARCRSATAASRSSTSPATASAPSRWQRRMWPVRWRPPWPPSISSRCCTCRRRRPRNRRQAGANSPVCSRPHGAGSHTSFVRSHKGGVRRWFCIRRVALPALSAGLVEGTGLAEIRGRAVRPWRSVALRPRQHRSPGGQCCRVLLAC